MGMAKRSISPPATALTVAAFVAGLVAPAGPACADENSAAIRPDNGFATADDSFGLMDAGSSSDEFAGLFEAVRRASGELAVTVTTDPQTARVIPVDSSRDSTGDPEPAQTRLPTPGDSPMFVWSVGAAAILTGAVIALAVRGRRRLLRGAEYW